MWISNGGPIVYVSAPMETNGYCELLSYNQGRNRYYVRPIGTQAIWTVRPEWITL